MATENLLDRRGDADHTRIENDINDSDDDYYDDDDVEEISRAGRWRAAIARCGFWTLALAVAAPASLHYIEIFYLRSPQSVVSKPSWFPKKSMDAASVFLSLLISLSFWFGWAEGGVIRRPKEVAVECILYLTLTLAWDQIVFEHGAKKFGLAIGFARYLVAEQLSNVLKELNRTASRLVSDSVFWNANFATNINLCLIFW
ncbi:hypothetical protein RHGRI_021452 [Rhododendron griersonianum]|uniref:Uncharacterized protein n=1 Tax=Rhododendron griersonianum TaxID=479676 RepID=A0AAV6JNE8_9ERIC|nr:hypothetical protein RHGRI_021452 [Rhododendron griersonianum]